MISQPWIIFLPLFLFSYVFINFYLSMIFLASFVYFGLKALYLIGGISFNSGSMKESVLFYQKFQGKYSVQCPKLFQESCNILSKFGLTDKYEYTTFGYFTDNPKEVGEENTKAVVGIKFTPSDSDCKIHAELESFLKENKNWFRAEIPSTPMIVSKVYLVHMMFLIFAIWKYYAEFEKMKKNADFLKKMRTTPENIRGVMEVYKPSGEVDYNVPLNYHDKYLLYENTKQ